MPPANCSSRRFEIVKKISGKAIFLRFANNSASVKVTLITRDEAILDAVSSIAAAAGVEISVAPDAESVRKIWRSSELVLIGVDLASLVAGLGLNERSNLHLVGEDAAELLSWSVPLGAPALELPGQAGFLSSLLSGPTHLSDSQSITLRVIGGSGGVGVSTLAAGLAQRAADRSARTCLIELDDHGGGIDLMFGAEKLPGWRWGELSSATGFVSDIGSQLPSIGGVELVSLGRSDVGLPSAQAVRAVARSLQRSHEVIVLDGGLASSDSEVDADFDLLVVAADVKAVMAARSRIRAYDLQGAELVVRKSTNWCVDPQLVGETLGIPVSAVVPQDARMSSSASRGGAPGSSGMGKFVKACDRLLDDLIFSGVGR